MVDVCTSMSKYSEVLVLTQVLGPEVVLKGTDDME